MFSLNPNYFYTDVVWLIVWQPFVYLAHPFDEVKQYYKVSFYIISNARMSMKRLDERFP